METASNPLSDRALRKNRPITAAALQYKKEMDLKRTKLKLRKNKENVDASTSTESNEAFPKLKRAKDINKITVPIKMKTAFHPLSGRTLRKNRPMTAAAIEYKKEMDSKKLKLEFRKSDGKTDDTSKTENTKNEEPLKTAKLEEKLVKNKNKMTILECCSNLVTIPRKTAAKQPLTPAQYYARLGIYFNDPVFCGCGNCLSSDSDNE